MFPPGRRSPDPGGPSRQLGATCPVVVRTVTTGPKGPLPSTLWRRHLRLFSLGSTHPSSSQTSLCSKGHGTGTPTSSLSSHVQTLPVHFSICRQNRLTDSCTFSLVYNLLLFLLLCSNGPRRGPSSWCLCFLTFLLNFFSAVLSRLNLHSVTFTHCECVIQ